MKRNPRPPSPPRSAPSAPRMKIAQTRRAASCARTRDGWAVRHPSLSAWRTARTMPRCATSFRTRCASSLPRTQTERCASLPAHWMTTVRAARAFRARPANPCSTPVRVSADPCACSMTTAPRDIVIALRLPARPVLRAAALASARAAHQKAAPAPVCAWTSATASGSARIGACSEGASVAPRRNSVMSVPTRRSRAVSAMWASALPSATATTTAPPPASSATPSPIPSSPQSSATRASAHPAPAALTASCDRYGEQAAR